MSIHRLNNNLKKYSGFTREMQLLVNKAVVVHNCNFISEHLPSMNTSTRLEETEISLLKQSTE